MGKNNAGVASRKKQFQVRLSATEIQMLEELAAAEELTPAEWIRFRIRYMHVVAFGRSK